MAKFKKPGDDESKSYVEKVAEKIIAALEDGTAPWIRPWKGGELSIRKPINPLTNKPYKGINMLNLAMEAMLHGYNDPRWLTYKQAKSINAQVKTGEKGTTIQYWKFTDQVDKTDDEGKKVYGEDGKPIKVTVELENPKVFYSTVFNAGQIDGMPQLDFGIAEDFEFKAIEAAERIISNSGADIIHLEQGRAFYSPSKDRITLPVKEQFKNEMGYYSTALHELGHWTGHSSRLNREMGDGFGTEGYAREELRAEIASYMICSELGVDFDPSNHNSYIEGWVSILKDKPNEIFKAAADAGKINQYLTNFNSSPEIKVEETTSSLLIDFKRAEGPSALCVAKTFTSFEDVNRYMLEMSETAPDIGYDKCDFHVDFGNGDTYSGRYDLKHRSVEIPDLAKHIKEDLLFYSGDFKPDHMTNGQYEDLLHMYGDLKEEAAACLQRVSHILDPEPVAPDKDRTFLESTYLSVPYSQKEEAKALGAKWDKNEKSWFAPAGLSMSGFSKFLPTHPYEPIILDVKGYIKDQQTQGRVELYQHNKPEGISYQLVGGDVKQGTFEASWYYDVSLDSEKAARHYFGQLKPEFSKDEFEFYAEMTRREQEIRDIAAQAPEGGSVKDALASLNSMGSTHDIQLR